MISYTYSGTLEFPGQVLELSMPVGRGTKGPPRPPVVSGMGGFIAYPNFKALLRALFSSPERNSRRAIVLPPAAALALALASASSNVKVFRTS